MTCYQSLCPLAILQSSQAQSWLLCFCDNLFIKFIYFWIKIKHPPSSTHLLELMIFTIFIKSHNECFWKNHNRFDSVPPSVTDSERVRCGNDLAVKPWPNGDLAKDDNGLPLTFMQWWSSSSSNFYSSIKIQHPHSYASGPYDLVLFIRLHNKWF